MEGFIATVSSIEDTDSNGDPSTARVLPATANGVVTAPFAVYWPLRAGEGNIKVGDKVICLQLEGGTGLILCRPDGSWTQQVGGTVKADDFNGGGISLSGHTHSGVHGSTSAPH